MSNKNYFKQFLLYASRVLFSKQKHEQVVHKPLKKLKEIIILIRDQKIII